MLKNKKGITLVALIVTIIILLILAGVSIASLTESGLFEKARQAEQKSENAQIKEEEILADYENKIGEYINGSRETVTLSKEQYEELVNRLSTLENDLENTKVELSTSLRSGIASIDFNNVIEDAIEQETTYTAVEDCIVVGYMMQPAAGINCSKVVNGCYILSRSDAGKFLHDIYIPLKKGDTFAFGTYNPSYKLTEYSVQIYGIK